MKRLRQILCVLLAIHIGFAQAGMVHTVASKAVAGEQIDAPAAAPCQHHTAPAQTPPSDHGHHNSDCCGVGGCHCSAACGMPVVPMAVVQFGGASAPRFEFHSAPAMNAAPDLRPPIH
jgi:hypothetical protein